MHITRLWALDTALHIDYITDFLIQVDQALKKLEVGTVITLANGARWLGMDSITTSNLYVRADFPDMIRVGPAYRKSKQWPENTGTTICTGTTGKQRFLELDLHGGSMSYKFLLQLRAFVMISTHDHRLNHFKDLESDWKSSGLCLKSKLRLCYYQPAFCSPLALLEVDFVQHFELVQQT